VNYCCASISYILLDIGGLKIERFLTSSDKSAGKAEMNYNKLLRQETFFLFQGLLLSYKSDYSE